MSLNKFMHKRNPFKNKRINFQNFAEKYMFFKEVFSGAEINVDFKCPSHIAAISRALLLESMNLDVHLPLDRLIPTIPLRMNYILWLEDLLNDSKLNVGLQINVFDIGCGASCIYPLLGASKNNWFFKASDIDDLNITVAKENVIRNNLSHKIDVIKVPDNDLSFLNHAFNQGTQISYYHFVMCNPPFFADTIDKCSVNITKNPDRDASKSVNTSSRTESLTDGGEIEFTKNLIDQSVAFKDQIGIFTVMLGRKSSSETIKKYLISKSISNHSIYEFCQGRIMRWGVAWSHLPDFKHPKSEFQLNKEQHRPPLLWNIPVDMKGISDYSVPGVYETLKRLCNRLEMDVLEQRNKQSHGGGTHLLLTANKNTWSHQRRKRRELQKQLAKMVEKSADKDEEPEAKRRKIDHICEEAKALDSSLSDVHSSESNFYDCVMKCTINLVLIVESDLPIIQLQARYLDGDREAMNQVVTHFKNILQKPADC